MLACSTRHLPLKGGRVLTGRTRSMERSRSSEAFPFAFPPSLSTTHESASNDLRSGRRLLDVGQLRDEDAPHADPLRRCRCSQLGGALRRAGRLDAGGGQFHHVPSCRLWRLGRSHADENALVDHSFDRQRNGRCRMVYMARLGVCSVRHRELVPRLGGPAPALRTATQGSGAVGDPVVCQRMGHRIFACDGLRARSAGAEPDDDLSGTKRRAQRCLFAGEFFATDTFVCDAIGDVVPSESHSAMTQVSGDNAPA